MLATIGSVLLVLGAAFALFMRKSSAASSADSPSLFRRRSQTLELQYIVKSGDSLGEIANRYGVKVSDIVKINNLDNPNDISVNQVLNLPAGAKDSGNKSSGSNTSNKPKPSPSQSKETHTVKSGDSLGVIAKKYAVSVSDIVKINNLDNPNDIRVGQVLKLPADAKSSGSNSSKPDTKPKPSPSQSKETHTVKSGDSLGVIAKKYAVSVSDIVKINNLDNPNDIRVGQVLKLPADAKSSGSNSSKPDTKPKPTEPNQSQDTYTVKSGDFLSKIAKKCGVSVSDIVKINNLNNPNDIRVGQVLKLKASTSNNGNNSSGNTHIPDKPHSNDRCTAKFHKISRVILRHEGGYVNDPNDAGGKTNKGIAWRTWQKFSQTDLGVSPTTENLKNITEEQAEIIYRKRYWQPQGFCEVKNDRIGLMVYDWTITSGGAGKQVQRLLRDEFNQKVVVDGAIGPNTIKALNNVANQNLLLYRITAIRKEYYHMLVRKEPKNQTFIKGWINRVNDCLEVKL